MARKELEHSPCSYPAMKVDPRSNTDTFIYPVVRFVEDGTPKVVDPITGREIAVTGLHLTYDVNNVARVEIHCLMYREPKQDGGKKGG